jgi:transposase-like protein
LKLAVAEMYLQGVSTRKVTAVMEELCGFDVTSSELRSVFDAPDRSEAERLLGRMVDKYTKSAPKLAAWLEANVPEGLTVFMLPAKLRRRLRTNNLLERLNREIKRRTRVATLFPNENSLLRLATAVLMETDEEWQTEKRYLPMKTT